MHNNSKFYIDGRWQEPETETETDVQLDIINPATDISFTTISCGTKDDVDKAVIAANSAFESWSNSTLEYRLNLLTKLAEIYERRFEEMAQIITTEMGAPITLSRNAQTSAGLFHIKNFIHLASKFEFEYPLHKTDNTHHIIYEPIGVCGLITPWNWPINQITMKVIPALAVGCTVVLKPSEISPMCAMLFAEMIDEAGFPNGVFNLVNGTGIGVGEALSKHPGIQMISFTGSTVAGKAVSKAASETVKRVTLELGGKSPNIIFADANLEKAAKSGAFNCFSNCGQTCIAPTRMIVERSVYDEVVKIATTTANNTKVDDPTIEGKHIGPLASRAQFDKVQSMIQMGIDEGATLSAGGVGRPEGVESGCFVKPTVFSNVTNQMQIAQQEIFGPVVVIIPFDTEDEAIQIANDTPYGLDSRIQTSDMSKARRVARQIRAGRVQINGKSPDGASPFGGYKQSGNGREGGHWGLEDYMEVKAISGWQE